MKRTGVGVCCLALVIFSVWCSGRPDASGPSVTAWTEVTPGILRSPGSPAGYAILDGDRALLIDAPVSAQGLGQKGVKKIDEVLLTHHHRDSLAALDSYLSQGVSIRAPKASAPWISVPGVTQYWKESLPLRSSRTAYLVLPQGNDRISCNLVDGTVLNWGGWKIETVTTPGHSIDHVAFLATKKGGKRVLFCGDAVSSSGKIWSPYTTDHDHWTDAGLGLVSQSLQKLARLNADILLPAHGDAVTPRRQETVTETLRKTAVVVDEVGFLKSYERYTNERRKDPPVYKFLAKEQAGSNGAKPWSKLSAHLWLTGNTFVLISKDGPCLVVDPWDPNSAKQIPKLQKDEKIGKVEVVLCSHAHFDHYDGAYVLLNRDRPDVWALEEVAGPVADPFRLRAPFLDERPLKFTKTFRDGQSTTWREYTLKFHFLPGQTLFTMAVETTIDGKKCLFTGDNFFHHELYSGTGGWMGLNRSGPLLYASSARKVGAIKPDWVLAEHGSAMEFNADDFRRRVDWAMASARAADALSPTGQHRHDWNPHHVRIEPVLQQARAGKTLTAELVVEDTLGKRRTLDITLSGRKLTSDQNWKVEVKPAGVLRKKIQLKLAETMSLGRHIFPLHVTEGNRVEPGDAFVVVDVVQDR